MGYLFIPMLSVLYKYDESHFADIHQIRSPKNYAGEFSTIPSKIIFRIDFGDRNLLEQTLVVKKSPSLTSILVFISEN